MIKIKKFSLLLVCSFLFLSMNCLFTCAAEIDEVPLLEEIDLPEDLNFSVNDTCTKHAYFEQAAANENGCFAVYSLHVNPDAPEDVDYTKKYIDIYNSDGTLLQEISFYTTYSLAFELKENTINIYFRLSALVYDLATQEIKCYAIPEGLAVNGKLYNADGEEYKQLRSKVFTAGGWTYSCKKGLYGYTELIRSNGEQEQVVVEMLGSDEVVFRAIPACIEGAIIIAISIFVKRRVKRDKDKTGYKTGDGSMSRFQKS